MALNPKVDVATNVRAEDVIAALRRASDNVVALLRSGIDPTSHALGVWNVAELAVHLSHAWMAIPGLITGDRTEARKLRADLPDEGGLMGDLWESGDIMVEGVKNDRERDLRVIADRIESSANVFLERLPGLDPWEEINWVVAGVMAPRLRLMCHLLSETVLHTYDLEKTSGRPHTMRAADAKLLFDGLLMPIIQKLGRVLVNEKAARGFKGTFEIRIRTGSRYLFAFEDGDVTVTESHGAPRDCVISGEPVALLLVIWGRESQYKMIAKGKLFAWGRKPWLATKMRTLLRNP